MKTDDILRAFRENRGSTIVYALLLLLGFLSLAVGGLLSATSDLKGSRNYNTGVQALLSGESGLLHGQKAVDDYGVVRFDTNVIPNWGTIFGSGPVTMSGHAHLGYSVAAATDPTNPMESMYLTANGTAPGESQRSLRSRLKLDLVFSPGAIYLPDPGVNSTFVGNSFLVDGFDRNLDGSPGIGDDVPGIATATSTSATSVAGTLNLLQQDNVIGIGGLPSVFRASGPDLTRVKNEIVPDITSRLGVVTNPILNGNDIFGTTLIPQLTYFTATTKLNGNVNGAGILVVDGGLTINGNLNFTGLIIVRGTTEITTVLGNATVLGALWTTDLSLKVGGSASVTYSTQALALANGIGTGNMLPRRVKAAAWRQL